MALRDIIAHDGRIFVKSEWGPISDDWPAVSFSKRSVGDRLRELFNPTRDVILYVGTSGAMTEKPAHRRRLLSAVTVEPSRIYDTRQLVPPAAWARAQQMFKDRWKFSMAARRAWDIPSLPLAPEVIPETYRMLGWRQNWGNVVEVQQGERPALLELLLVPIELNLQAAGTAFDDKRAAMNLDAALKNAIGRMVGNIRERVRASRTPSLGMNPLRFAESELHILLMKKWNEQQGRCALCAGELELEGDNKLVQCSPDRIDSAGTWYDAQNVHITHLGCNLAKSDVLLALFEEWLDVVRSRPAESV